MSRHSVEWWNNLREATFDKWAENYGVVYKEIEGLDFELAGKHKVYPSDIISAKWKREEDWLKKSKSEKKFLYTVFYLIPEALEWIIVQPRRMIIDACDWIRFRTYDKYHVVHLKLKPDYYEPETRMENAIWVILTEFIEHEAAWMNIICGKEGDTKEQRDAEIKNFRKTNVSRKDGIEYLDFHINQTERDTQFPYPDDKIQRYKQIKEAYIYYRDTRPELVRQQDTLWDEWHDLYREDRKSPEERKKFEEANAKEQEIFDLDTKFLKYIVDARNEMWT